MMNGYSYRMLQAMVISWQDFLSETHTFKSFESFVSHESNINRRYYHPD